MSKYAICLSYNGTRLHGWQNQLGVSTVQSELEYVFSTYFRKKITIVGCGRTDTGVHASYYIAHTVIENEPNIPVWIYVLNKMLSKDIAIASMAVVEPSFHARFLAIEREYTYNLSIKKSVWNAETSYFFPLVLDLELLNEASSKLIGTKDFGAFCKARGSENHKICTIIKASWEKKEDIITFTIRANRFLRNMVRAIVGTLLEVGQNKISINDFELIIDSMDRNMAKRSAPAKGLFLCDVKYKTENLDITNFK